jgi:hypothetical protein
VEDTILFSNFLPLSSISEGFISFSYDKNPLNFVDIPQYTTPTSKVLKLYDSLFYDLNNGNMIDVQGDCSAAAVPPACVVDSSGTTINGIYIVQRDGKTSTNINTINNQNNTKLSESNIQWKNLFDAWSYNSRTTNNDKYQLFYYSWNDSTYVHIMDCIKTKHLKTFLFTGDKSSSEISWTTDVSSRIINVTRPITSVEDTSNNLMVTDLIYDSSKTVFQINRNIEFDINNSNIILKKITKAGATDISMSVYNRSGTEITATYKDAKVTTVSNIGFNAWAITDSSDILLYMPVATKTLVTVLQKLSTTPVSYRILSHNRFNVNGIDVSTPTPATPTVPAVTAPTGTGTVTAPTGTGTVTAPTETRTADDDYQKWLAYWNTVVNANGNYSQDYLLKTQIVPPVCPSCPSCPRGGGACINCGGLGGSGTQGAAAIGAAGAVGAVGNGDKKQFDATSKGSGNFVTTANTSTLGGATSTSALGVVSGAENIAQTGAGAVGTVVKTGADVVNKTVDKTGNVLTSAGSGATNLVGGTIGTAANLVSGAGSGTVGLIKDAGSGIKDAGSGAVGLLKDTASGAVGLAKDAGSEAKGLLKDAGSGATKVLNQGQNQRYGYNQGQNNGQGYNQGQNNGQGMGQGQGQGRGQNNSGWIQPGAMQQGVNGVDLYSGYGALPPKGSDFIPVTSDFSAFGK